RDDLQPLRGDARALRDDRGRPYTVTDRLRRDRGTLRSDRLLAYSAPGCSYRRSRVLRNGSARRTPCIVTCTGRRDCVPSRSRIRRSCTQSLLARAVSNRAMRGGAVMRDHDTRRLDTFGRVRDFFADNIAILAKSARGQQLVASLIALIGQLRQFFATQTQGRGEAQNAAKARAEARASLRDRLEAMARTAQILALDHSGLDR